MGKKYKGFSLIEILVVVALIVILATITIVAINPAKNFRDTRNAQRSADIMQILNAVTQYTSEQGHFLSDLGTIETCPTPTTIVDGVADTGEVNLANVLVDDYIVAIPEDPNADPDDPTAPVYTICQTPHGRVEVSATKEGTTEKITVKR